MLQSNTTLVVLDLRHNSDVMLESLSKIRQALRDSERGMSGQYSWLGNVSGCSSDGRSVKSVVSKNGIIKDRVASMARNGSSKFVAKSSVTKKEKDYAEVLEEQLQEEISHRQQLEELNLQLVDQMKQLKQQQIRLWSNGAHSSGSEQSFEGSSRSCDRSSSSGSSSSVPIDQSTLSYIQQAFKDIYAFIKNNQCSGHEIKRRDLTVEQSTIEEVTETSEMDDYEPREHRTNFMLKKVQSTHVKIADNVKMNKITKSAHLLGDTQRKDVHEMKPEMIERQMGDSRNAHVIEEQVSAAYEKGSPASSVVSDSSDTLCSPAAARRAALLNPRDALYSSSDSD